MFVPFFIIKRNMIIQGIFLLTTGPVMAAFITDNLMEQASIWCFFSISQILSMAFLFHFRKVVILKWRSFWGTKPASTKKIAAKQQ